MVGGVRHVASDEVEDHQGLVTIHEFVHSVHGGAVLVVDVGGETGVAVEPDLLVRLGGDGGGRRIPSAVAHLIAHPSGGEAGGLRGFDERWRLGEGDFIVLVLRRQGVGQRGHGLHMAGVGLAENKEMGIFHNRGKPWRGVSMVAVSAHVLAIGRFADDKDEEAFLPAIQVKG